MLFTSKQHCLHFFFRGTYLQLISVFMNFKFGDNTILAVQLFKKIKLKEKKEKKKKKKTKNMFRCVSRML